MLTLITLISVLLNAVSAPILETFYRIVEALDVKASIILATIETEMGIFFLRMMICDFTFIIYREPCCTLLLKGRFYYISQINQSCLIK